MTKQTKNKIVTVMAILLLSVAVFLTILLFIGDDGAESETKTQAAPTTVTTTVPSTEYTGSVTQEAETENSIATSAEAKYLWDYGPGSYSYGKTAEQDG